MADRAGPPPHGDAHQLAHYWAHGQGAQQIRWPEKGAFDRCTRLLMQHAHMTPDQAKGYCAERHHEALGYWPGQHGNKKGRSVDGTCTDCGELHDVRTVESARWDAGAALSSCADSTTPATCYRSICAGKKDGDPALQSSWALPHHPSPGAPADLAGVRNALSRLPQTQGLTNTDEARHHLEAHLNAAKGRSDDGHVHEHERTAPFEVEQHGDGLTLSGYAAVFNSPTTIRDMLGEYTETILPGAFARSLADKTPVLMFEHGRHPLIGSMPLGVIHRAAEDQHGLHIEARLTDNWLIQPVRDAVRDGAVDGMSFRFTVPKGGDSWNDDGTERSIHEVRASELGPVVFPAYEPTTASVRGLIEHLPDVTGRPAARSTGGGEHDGLPGHGGPASHDRAALPTPADLAHRHAVMTWQRLTRKRDGT